MVDPVVAQPTPPKTPLIVQVFDGFNRPLPDAEVEVVNFRSELKGASSDVKKKSDARGRAEFGPVDPRIQFDIKVRKSGFGPPGNPFAPGENRIVRRTPLKGVIQMVLTRNVARLTVIARDATAAIPLAGASIGVDGITGTPMPLSGADGRAGSFEVPVGVAIRFHAEKANFGPQPGGAPFNGVAEGTHTFTDGEEFEVTLLLHQAPLVSPVVDVADLVVLLKKAHTTPKRKGVTFRTDAAFDGSAHLEFEGTGAVQVFRTDTGGTAIAAGTDIFAGVVPTTGVTLFLEGATVSGAMKSLTMKLVLTGGTKTKLGPAKTTITVVDLTLDLCRSRTAAATDPTPLSAEDKFTKGRFIHKQFGTKHGRAMLIVRKAKPDDFAGTLVINATTVGSATKPKIFGEAHEIPAAGQAALAFPLEVTGVTAAGKKFFVEGDGVSGALTDITLQLGVKGLDDDGDRARVTVVQFTDLKADIPSTPANQVRNRSNGGTSNSPVARHSLVLANAGAAVESDYDPDYTTNVPVVLVEGSVRGGDEIVLTVKVAPPVAKPKVSWSILRDRRAAAPKGDDAKIIALPGNSDDPGLVRDADPLKVKLSANAVGSFHIVPFIDNNDNGTNEFDDNTGKRIDREPYICMNLVLVRVQGVSNLCVANSAARHPGRPATAVRNYFGTGNLTVPANFSSGDFAGTGNDAMTMHVIAHLIGGGDDGKRGLDQVFGAWSNNELDCPTSPGPGGHGEDVTHTFRRRNPPPPAPPNPSARTRCFWRLDGTETFGPMLDAGAFSRPNRGTGGNTCTSTNGAAPVEPAGTPDPSGIGERREYRNPDSPGGGILLEHPADTGVAPAVNRRTLRNFKFNIDFRCALLFWTNRDKVPGPVDKPACRLYSSVSTNSWTVRFESSYDDNFAETPVVAQTIALVKDAAPTRRATPIDGSGFETRAPGGVDVLVVDVPF